MPDITSRIRIDDTGLKQVVGEAEKTTKGIGASFERLGAGLRKWGAGLTAAVSLPILAIGSAAVKAASDFGETQSKANTVFRGMEQDLERIKKTSIETWGLSKQSALEALSMFGSVAQGMGMTRDESFRLAESVVTLTSDFSSFHNLPFEQVSAKIRGALTGEYEGLKELGIVLDDASVKKRALMDTGKAHQDQLTQEELVNARLALIYEKAGVAVGDYARTKDSAANRSRAVKERLEELSITLGERLLPVFERALDVIEPVLTQFGEMDTGTQNLIVGVGALAIALGPVMVAVGALIPIVKGLAAALMFLWANPVGLLIGALALLAVGIVKAYQESEEFRRVVDTVIDVVQVGFATAIKAGLVVLQQIGQGLLLAAEQALTFGAALVGWTTPAGVALRNAREDIGATRVRFNDEISAIIKQVDIYAEAHVQQALDNLNRVQEFVWNLDGKVIRIRTAVDTGDITRAQGGPVKGLQHGGFVRRLRPYLVGEAGPEWFVPRMQGFIVNMRQAAAAIARLRAGAATPAHAMATAPAGAPSFTFAPTIYAQSGMQAAEIRRMLESEFNRFAREVRRRA